MNKAVSGRVGKVRFELLEGLAARCRRRQGLGGRLWHLTESRTLRFDSFVARGGNEGAEAFSENLTRDCDRRRGFSVYFPVKMREIEHVAKAAINF